MLDTIEEANDEIVKAIKEGRNEDAIGLLEQTQQAVIGVGNSIESAQGEGTGAVAALENYCECAYQCHEALCQGEDMDPEEVSKALHQWIQKAGLELRDVIPTEKEVVFLPYKAAMWDSLEGEWRRLLKEDNCAAYVIPIPYFEKNADGSLGEMHYEIKDFPRDVPVIRYEIYDFEKRHPDAIYIHNPYDDINIVTTVPPFFYSSNLKELTEELVYIPYFVLRDIDPNDAVAVQNVQHFAMVPAVKNADRVIVQSENLKQIYVNTLTKIEGEQRRAYWEQKIEGTGSPKFERVENLRDEDYEIPEEWRALLTKPNGVRKKALLYNTGVTAFINLEDRMMEKIKETLALMKTYQDEIVLWWRPHPLMDATIRAMEPQLWEEYSRTVEQYRAEGWGIYDDTPNLDRAIACTDGYYGDNSSLVQLYEKTKKPIMIQRCLEETSN